MTGNGAVETGLTRSQRDSEAWVRIQAAAGNLAHIAAHPDSPLNRDLLEGAVTLLIRAGEYLEAA